MAYSHNVLEYSKKELDDFRMRLIYKIYGDFVANQRNQAMREAGMDTIDKIGREAK